MTRKEKNIESAIQRVKNNQRTEKMRISLCIDYIDNFPPLTKDILSQKLEDNTEDCDIYLGEDEIITVSTELMPFIKEVLINIEEEQKNFEVNALNTFESIIKVTDIMFTCVEDYSSVPDGLMQIIFYLNKNLRSDVVNLKVRDMICALCEKCCQKRLELSGSFVSETLYFLFDRSLKDSNKNPQREIKRIMNLQEVLSRLDVDGTIFKQLSQKFFQTIKSPGYLSCKGGQQFISFLLTFDLKLMKKVHKTIKLFLLEATKNQATAFGKIYHTAWLNSTEETRQAIEKHCIQDLMMHIFTLKRSPGFMEMSSLGKNVLAILSYFHLSRRLIHLSKVITELYTPLIWSNLRSGNNIIRCNAAEVFLDVYPFEKPGVGRADQAIFLQRQHDEMADLLTDNCHVVRIIAAKGICSCFKNLWETFTPESIKVLMETMVNDMINDASSDVRKAVFQGFTSMLKNRTSAAYLAKVLPSLRDHIHDESEKVRRAFVDMLIQIKELPEIVPLNYFDVVPAKHLTARLALENETVGRSLVRLIMSEIYVPDQPWSAIMKRIYKMILMNHEAARKLFTFSKKILPVDAIIDIITNTLIVMYNRFKEVVETKSENAMQEESDALHKKKRRRQTEVLREVNGNESVNSSLESNTSSSSPDTNSNDVNVQPERHQLDDLNVCQVFIEIVTILWTINMAHLNNQADKDKKKFERFNNVTASCVPLFLRYFKGTKVYFSVIHFASLIPLSKLTPISTIASMCVSHLKGLSKNCKDEETEVYVNALCTWRRAPEVLELATDWLDQAFRSERLNQSAALRSSARRKVKFPQCEAKPLLALKLIDIIFKYELNRAQVLEKYDAVYEMFTYLKRVKVLIERRLSMDGPFPDAELSDEFLQKSLYRYAKLMLILHKPDSAAQNGDESSSGSSIVSTLDSKVKDVYAPKSFPKLTDWAIGVLVQNIPENLDDESDDLHLSVNLLRLIVRSGSLMISANFTDKFCTSNFINFINILLESGCKLAFVDDALRALKELVFHCETHYERDEENLLRNELPALLTNILYVLMESKLKKDVFAVYLSNFTEMKNCLLSLPLALIRSFGLKSQILRNTIVAFTTSCIRVMADDIQEVGIFDKTDKLQNLPYCSFFIARALLSRESICGLWFNCLPEVTSSLGDDSNQVLAMVSLLHTLSFVKKPKHKELLVKAVKHTHEVIKALPAEKSNKSTDESLDSSMKETLSPRKFGIPVLEEIAARLGCVLV